MPVAGDMIASLAADDKTVSRRTGNRTENPAAGDDAEGWRAGDITAGQAVSNEEKTVY